ncbi:PAS domain S-box protein [Burkholderia multivorans]|uniref:sensor histidine kinase n=1 Tax=Burkholderia multivorans TaxID=87883 RepID=UPI000D39DC26|nr:ATP-binding protein [Burkholderia multivorans]MBR8016829.1 PAS domain S-box protein [Burkholderia multivorans]MEB2524469.1 PAS domain S-box protein [Burkholderia multivorans]MEB2594478.1 PAS domain S-box protein [Burkholderia multivorans]PTO49746.1 PAS domain-containing sensor histidine kinase [Burkholderia multivorans]HEF4728573.1 PAS domain S-box protein [Burkholderia multivorans]
MRSTRAGAMLGVRPRDAARLVPDPTMRFPDEDDFHRLLDALTTCVLLHDAQTKAIVWANRAACIALGFSVEELLPLKAPDMTRPEPKYRREIGVGAMDRAIVEGPQVYEWCYRSRTGVDMLSEAIATYVPLRGRDVVMVQFRDISAEEAIRQQLHRYEARLREFMQDLDEGIAVVTPHGGVQFISESGRRVLGLAADEAVGDVLDYCSADDRARLVAQLRDAPSTCPSEPQRYRFVRRDGSTCWLRVACRQVEIEGDLDGLLVHFRDVSDEVAIEEARRAEARMLEYAGRYNAMGEMATVIAHELSQPLAAVRNFIEGAVQRLGARGNVDDAIWGLRSADRQAEHAALIIKSVREFIVKREPVVVLADLRDILADVAYFIELRAREAGVTVSIVQADVPLPVRCERVLIGQVILNLAFNAIEAFAGCERATRRLTLGTAQVGALAELRAVDNGPGVADDAHDRLFDGFSSSKAGGNGIGLSLCKSIVTRHGGRIAARRAEGGGLDCRVTLPLADARA